MYCPILRLLITPIVRKNAGCDLVAIVFQILAFTRARIKNPAKLSWNVKRGWRTSLDRLDRARMWMSCEYLHYLVLQDLRVDPTMPCERASRDFFQIRFRLDRSAIETDMISLWLLESVCLFGFTYYWRTEIAPDRNIGTIRFDAIGKQKKILLPFSFFSFSNTNHVLVEMWMTVRLFLQ